MDLDKKIDGKCFVVGLEILDNMPHDRLFTAASLGNGSEATKFTHASIINRSSVNPEKLIESKVIIE